MGSYRQFSSVQYLGDRAYFPLRISKTSLEDGLRETVRVFERYVFLTAYDEVFEANWDMGNRPLGRLNPQYNYKQTIRKVNINFNLPARNVAEAKSNLDFCSGLANLVYGDYARVGDSEDSFVYQGANLRNRIKFGNLIRNELCFFEEFSFTPNFDAGVFEFGAALSSEGMPIGIFQDIEFSNDSSRVAETGYVYHSDKGKVYPKEINVTLAVLIVIENGDFLGFGGPNRLGNHQRRWALNTGKDWPHGTGPIGVMRYMAATSTVTDGEGEEQSDEEILRSYLEERRREIGERGNIDADQPE